MNALRPSPRLLRHLALLLAGTTDVRARAWIDALPPRPEPAREFPGVSIVATSRRGRLCGYEVWRHLDTSRVDPTRKKARLWFGRRRNRGLGRALTLARAAAAQLSAMSRTELHEWWSEYRGARAHRRPVQNLWRDESRYEDRIGYEDLRQISCAFAR